MATATAMYDDDDDRDEPKQQQQPLVLQIRPGSPAPSPRSKLSVAVAVAVAAAALLGLLVAAFVIPRPDPATSVRPTASTTAKGRTGFHFQPPAAWMNDPNGPAFYKGWYHLFYQYNPAAPVWTSSIRWGHAVSLDLLHWDHLPVALQPSEWYDEGGVWSGSMTLLHDGSPVVLYTGVSNASVQTQNAAVPVDPENDPLLRRWRKLDTNPLIGSPPPGVAGTDFRDPTTAWWSSNTSAWRFVVGAKRAPSTGVALLYQSSDFFTRWSTSPPVELASAAGTGMWECPDFFPVSSTTYVLKVSLAGAHDAYVVGSFDVEAGRFSAAGNVSLELRRLDHGHGLYASKTFFDMAKQRRVLWAWLAEADTVEEDFAKGWASIQSLPRKLWLDGATGDLMQLPVDEVSSLREEHRQRTNFSLNGSQVIPASTGGDQADLEIVFELPDLTTLLSIENVDVHSSPEAARRLCLQRSSEQQGILGPFGVLVLATQDHVEQTAVYFHVARSSLGGMVALVCLDPSKSSTKSSNGSSRSSRSNSTGGGHFVELPVPEQQQQTLALRVVVDHSIVEVFAQGGRLSITSRVYPSLARGDAARVFIFNNGSVNLRVKHFDVWKMKTVNIR